MSQILAALQDNPYFGAGFGLMGLGLGASLARKGAQVGLILFRRHYMTTVEITCKDKVRIGLYASVKYENDYIHVAAFHTTMSKTHVV